MSRLVQFTSRTLYTAALLFAARLASAAEPAADGASALASEPPVVKDAEEIVVTGRRMRYELRLEMQAAERMVYGVFNELNDEPRFEIECDMHEITGTRLASQVCMPAFERQALTEDARLYLDAYRKFLDPYCADGGCPEPAGDVMPSGPTIARQQRQLQRKMREVAERHPEFVEALVRFVEAKTRYDQSRGISNEDEETP